VSNTDSAFPSSELNSRMHGRGSVQGFEDLVKLLEGSGGSAELMEVARSMGDVSHFIEQVSAHMLNKGDTEVGELLVELLTALRRHRTYVANLPPPWKELPEYINYMSALGNFRMMLNRWLAERAVFRERAQALQDFETVAWRTLGDGMLLMDVYQQAESQFQAIPTSDATTMAAQLDGGKAATWWGKLRG
jgi:hypothetical protein